MPTPYDGIGSNVTRYPALGVTIVGATGGSPIEITIAGVHNFIAGDMVDIYGHQVNPQANGRWSVVPTGASKFTLTGSTGSGTNDTSATGFATALGFTADMGGHPASALLPSDLTDDMDAASVNVALEAWADRTKRLAVNMPEGGYSLARLNPSFYASNDDSAGGNLFTYDNTGSDDGIPWATGTPSGVGFANALDLDGTVPLGPAGGATWNVSRVQTGDKIEIDFGFSASVVTGAANAAFFLRYNALSLDGTPSNRLLLKGSVRHLPSPSGITAVHIHGTTDPIVMAPGIRGDFVVLRLFVYQAATGGNSAVSCTGSYSLRVKLWRPIT